MNGREDSRALVICGSTASGKSAIALRVAELFGGEIVNADSRQVYRGMSIGTGMPTHDSLERVPHHLYGFLDPSQRYSAARFAADAARITRDICKRGKLAIIVGGTGFYVEALTGRMPLDRPPPDEALRARLRLESSVHPPKFLWEWLRVKAPSIAAGARPSDSYRILRGLERAMSEVLPDRLERDACSDIRFVVVRMSLPREELRRRIALRVHEMFRAGLMQEARTVRAGAPGAPALSGLGYAEALALWDGCATEQEAIRRTIARTEQYSKRQETWFRHMRDVPIIDALDEERATASIVALARERLVPA